MQGAQPNNGIFNKINTGDFIIEWLADDSWIEGGGNPSAPSLTGATYDSLGSLLTGSHEILGTYTYVPPGNSVPLTWSLNLTSGFLADATSGGDVSFLLRAADNSVGYLFNARSFSSNHPLITVNAIAAVPEPSTKGLIFAGAIFFWGIKRCRRTAK